MGLKSKIANRTLNSRLSSMVREKQVFNLDSAKTAGVLWEFDQKESFDQLIAELKSVGLKADALCYFQTKKVVIPDEIKGFSRKQTSWSGIPKSPLAEDFIHQKFDILIDLTSQKYFPVIFITALSEAAFKIGYAGQSANYFDLNVQFGEQPETSQLATQILYYLKRINKTTIE
jgi:hypothetical protein